MRRILIVEDERSIADTVAHCVAVEGYEPVWRDCGAAALDALRNGEFALMVLDVGLPDVNGFELCRAIREFSRIPIVFLTARDDEIDRVVGLELGGDDYVIKPFSPRELGARIKAVLRRGGDAPHSPEPRALIIEREKMRAVYHGRALHLTRYEFHLLALLAERPGRVFSREALLREVWGDDSPSMDRTVDAHIKSLRAKFRQANTDADPILTHRGTGYSLREEA